VYLVEAERFLHDSKIHEHIKEVLRHLHTEDQAWYLESLVLNGSNTGDTAAEDDGNTGSDAVEDRCDHPCFDIFLQNRFMDELCSRARQDRPR
jgi:hypothetical protein